MKSKLFWPITLGIHCAWILGLCLVGLKNQINAFTFGSYYILGAITIGSLWSVSIFLRSQSLSLSDFARRFRLPLFVAGVATAIVFISVTPEWRVLSDETNLLSTSRSFFIDRSAQNITMGKNYYDLFSVIDAGIPTRPLLFPFLTNIIHTLLGFRWQNPFILNALLSMIFFAALLDWFRRRGDWYLAMGALLAVLSFPIVTLGLSSAGFDFLAMALTLLVFVLLLSYLKRPNAPLLLVLFFALLLHAHTRYESILVFPLCVVSLFALKAIRWQDIEANRYIFGLTPLFLAPIFLQRFLTQGHYENPTGGAPLSPQYFFKYLQVLLASQFDFSFRYPYATAYFALSFGLLFYCLVHLARFGMSKKLFELQSWQSKWLILVTLLSSALNIVYISHHFGDATHPSQARFFMLWSVLWALVPSLLALKLRWLKTEFIFLAGLASFFVYHPFAVKNDFMKSLILPRETRYYMDYLIRNEPDKRILTIYERPGQIVAAGFGSVDHNYARLHEAAILEELKHGLYREIVVIQRTQIASGETVQSDTLSGHFKLETMAYFQATEAEGLKISRVQTP